MKTREDIMKSLASLVWRAKENKKMFIKKVRKSPSHAVQWYAWDAAVMDIARRDAAELLKSLRKVKDADWDAGVQKRAAHFHKWIMGFCGGRIREDNQITIHAYKRVWEALMEF